MTDSLNNVASSCLSLCPYHGSALANTAESLAQVPAAADEWNGERVLLHMVGVVGWSEDLGLVDIVNADSFENLYSGVSNTLCKQVEGVGVPGIPRSVLFWPLP